MLQNATKKSIYKRLPIYLDYCKTILETEPETKYISSTRMAEELFLGEVQVRKDLSKTCGSGKPKIGYSLKYLIQSIEEYLKCKDIRKAVIIGVGKLGSAILGFDELKKYGLDVIAGFDTNAENKKYNKPVYTYSQEKIKTYIEDNNVDVVIMCVPKKVAQDVCNLIVSLGIKIIWNFTPIRLKVPSDVIVQNENLAYSVSIMLAGNN